jgi:quercetin dioxygenase-like cupin family protein
MSKNSPYTKSHKITLNGFGSCNVYYMKPGGIEKKHFHNGIEIVYVIRGNCKTHKEGNVYIYKKGQIHEVINKSKNELVFVCLTIPPESKNNTHYL